MQLHKGTPFKFVGYESHGIAEKVSLIDRFLYLFKRVQDIYFFQSDTCIVIHIKCDILH